MSPPSLGLTEPLDFESDTPVYEQIKNRLKFAIARGAFGPETRLPSVRELAKSLTVNPNTVVRVFRDLEVEGLIYTRRGIGVFVAERAESVCIEERTSIVEARLREAVQIARRAELTELELNELWGRVCQEEL